MKQLLSIGADAKTIKGQTHGFTTGILYLAPHTIASTQSICPASVVAECQKACLYSAGRGKFNNVQKARIAKTQRFHADYENFMNDLVISIVKLVKKANAAGTTPLVRLNGTSDILWERKGFRITEKTSEYLGKYHGLSVTGYFKNIMEIFPNVQFYDYTKIVGRFTRDLPANYDLTFSYSGVEKYQPSVEMAVKLGARIAVVFRDQNFPSFFKGMRVVNGDNTDIRHNDPQGVIVGLYAKGSAKDDKSGFVVDTKELALV